VSERNGPEIKKKGKKIATNLNIRFDVNIELECNTVFDLEILQDSHKHILFLNINK